MVQPVAGIDFKTGSGLQTGRELSGADTARCETGTGGQHAQRSGAGAVPGHSRQQRPRSPRHDWSGRPQVNPVWFLSGGQYIYLSVKPETSKYRNLRANPAVAVSVGDLVRRDRYVEVRGEVLEFELFETLAWVNHLARKYTGTDFTRGTDAEHSCKVTIRVDSSTGQG